VELGTRRRRRSTLRIDDEAERLIFAELEPVARDRTRVSRSSRGTRVRSFYGGGPVRVVVDPIEDR